jgi:hypothetical protein
MDLKRFTEAVVLELVQTPVERRFHPLSHLLLPLPWELKR